MQGLPLGRPPVPDMSRPGRVRASFLKKSVTDRCASIVLDDDDAAVVLLLELAVLNSAESRVAERDNVPVRLVEASSLSELKLRLDVGREGGGTASFSSAEDKFERADPFIGFDGIKPVENSSWADIRRTYNTRTSNRREHGRRSS